MKTKRFRTKTAVLMSGLLLFSVVSTAVAAVPGDPFKLGVVNTINALTTLTGNWNSQLLLVNNTNTGTSARAIKATSRGPIGTVRAENNGGGPALALKVNAGVPPLTVDANAAKVANLDVDKLDGVDSSDFVRRATYSNFASSTGTCAGDTCFWAVFCDAGDVLLSGGYFGLDPNITDSMITSSGPIDFHHGWLVEWKNTGAADEITTYAYCGDLGAPHVASGAAPELPAGLPLPATP